MTTDIAKTRESAFELLRIIAQFMIVLYHILLVIVYPNTNISFFKAIWLPLHIGVPLFVMISGYFGIKADIKRLINYLGLVFVLQVPLLVADIIMGGDSNYFQIIFFLSDTPFWFIRTYFYLFLFSPIINYFLSGISDHKRVILLVILFILSHYEGTLAFDPSLKDGYCLITFIFYYVVGDTLKAYRNIWQKFSRRKLWLTFIAYNTILVVLFSLYGNIRGAHFIYERLFFSYQSIGLLFSSIVFFILIGGLSFHSNIINRIGKSSLAIYMLHGSNLSIHVLLPLVVIWLCTSVDGNPVLIMGLMILVTVVIVIFSWLIYELLMPIWTLIGSFSNYCQRRYDIMMKKYIQ